MAESKWWKSASCASVDPEIWFPEQGSSGTDAKIICASCPVRLECLTDAIDNDMTEGIWGGLNPAQRHEVAMGRAPAEMPAVRCRNGHELAGDNLRVTTKRDGSRRRNCVTCSRAQARKYKREHKARQAG